MKKSLYSMSIAALLAMNSIAVQAAADENLVYVAVDPCRLADTRSSTGGVIAANTTRNFLVSGAAGALNSQGGDTSGCAAPRASSGLAPVAISAYIVAVPTASSGAGFITAFPSLTTPGQVATVNFAAGQVIGNTTTITLCQGSSCPTAGPLAVIVPNTEQHVVIDVQGYFYPTSGSCPSDMVPAGSLCVDKYEASVWTAATGGSQLASGVYGCAVDGSTCGASVANAATAIYARSVPSVVPAASITWYQAAQACANVGKRLPTTAEWQMAASGTPAGGDGVTDCNSDSIVNTLNNTGALSTCVSSAGALDMVGNVMEFSADYGLKVATGGTSTDASLVWALGNSFKNNTTGLPTDTTALFILATSGPLGASSQIGFRCVK